MPTTARTREANLTTARTIETQTNDFATTPEFIEAEAPQQKPQQLG
jgi:hypothetical protein